MNNVIVFPIINDKILAEEANQAHSHFQFQEQPESRWTSRKAVVTQTEVPRRQVHSPRRGRTAGLAEHRQTLKAVYAVPVFQTIESVSNATWMCCTWLATSRRCSKLMRGTASSWTLGEPSCRWRLQLESWVISRLTWMGLCTLEWRLRRVFDLCIFTFANDLYWTLYFSRTLQLIISLFSLHSNITNAFVFSLCSFPSLMHYNFSDIFVYSIKIS